MRKLRQAFHEGRVRAVLANAQKANQGKQGTWFYTAIGIKERDILLDHGWTVINQDLSEWGAWVTRWYMRKG